VASDLLLFMNHQMYLWHLQVLPGIYVTQFQDQNSVVFSPQANYTDWATTTCWQNLVPTFADRGGGGRPTDINLFSRPKKLFFFQVAPHLSSQGLNWSIITDDDIDYNLLPQHNTAVFYYYYYYCYYLHEAFLFRP
jgi:hypothetical protein